LDRIVNMPSKYFWRKDLSKYTLKSFDSADEYVADTNNNDILTYNANGTTRYIAVANPPVISGVSAGSPTTLKASQSGSIVLFDNASGEEFVLPAPVAGLNYTFVVTTSVTSNDYEISTDVPGTTLFVGSLWEVVAAGTGTEFFPNGSTHSAIAMNGTTTGGLINTYITVLCVNSTTWIVDGTNMASGTIATPFTTS
jgi:hypothetical protein